MLLALTSKIPIAILSCLVILIPLLYFLKLDIKAIYQKPKLKDVGIAVLLFAGYMIYSLALMTVLEQFGIVGGDLIGESTVTVMSLFPLVFTLMTEELIKFIPFMFFLRVGYKYSGKRRLSVCLAMILVMAFFATLHAFNFNMLIFALFIQGFGSIFEFIGYIKTKNLLISYITHLCTDVFIFMTAILGL